MADIDIDLVDDQDALTAASLNSRFSTLRTGILALPEYAVKDRGLGPDHLPSLVIGINASPGLTRRFDVTPPYTASPAAYPGWGVDADWAVVDDGSGGTTINSGPLQITFDTIQLGMSNASRIGAMMVFYNLSLPIPSNTDRFYFCLQYRDTGAAWRTIRNTEIVVNPGRMLNTINGTGATLDIPFNTILREDEIGEEFNGLRVAHTTATPAAQYRINKASFTIIPLHTAVQ